MSKIDIFWKCRFSTGKLQRNRHGPQKWLLKRLKVQNASPHPELFKILKIVAGRNFWWQQIVHAEIAKFLKNKPTNEKSVAARNFWRQQKLVFWKLETQETHFAPTNVPIAIFLADVVSFEIWHISGFWRKLSIFRPTFFFPNFWSQAPVSIL